MSVLIVEGLTGTGKSSTIEALQSLAAFRWFDEEATFDDFMTEFHADRDAAARRARDCMARILDAVEANDPPHRFLLERFHFSQLALGSEPQWYETIGARCSALGARVAVLTLPDSALAARSLYRREYGDEDWQGLIASSGSEAAALETLRNAQARRIEAVMQSGLEYSLVDTSAADWERYAREIAAWMNWRNDGA